MFAHMNLAPEQLLINEKKDVAQLVKAIKDQQRIAILGHLILSQLQNIPKQQPGNWHNGVHNFSDSLPDSPLEIIRAITDFYQALGWVNPTGCFHGLTQIVDNLYVAEEEFTWIVNDENACMFAYIAIRNIGNGFLNEIYQNAALFNLQSNPSCNFLTAYQLLNLPLFVNSHADRVNVIKKYFAKQVQPNPNFNYKKWLITSLHEQWNRRFKNLVKPRSWEKKGVPGVYGKAIDFIFRQSAQQIPSPFAPPPNQVLEPTIGSLGLGGIHASTEEESKLNYYGLLWAIYGRAPGVSMLDLHKACDKYCTQIVSRELDAKHPQRIAERRKKAAQSREIQQQKQSDD